MDGEKQMKKKKLLLLVGLIFLAGSYLMLFRVPWKELFLSGNEIAAGVYIDGEPVGHFTNAELKDWLEEKNTVWKKQHIYLMADGERFAFTLDEIGAAMDIEAVMNAAYGVGRQGNFFMRFRERTQPVLLNYCFKLDKNIAVTHLRQLQEHINMPVQNGNITVNSQGEIVIIPSVEGKKLSIEKSVANIRDSLTWDFAGEVPLAIITTAPFPTTEEINSWQINGVITSFTTEYQETEVNRTHNIMLAAKKLDNILLMPGELFSFNELVGPRDAAHGYEKSLIIFNQSFTEGYGGGICQLVSTLYNAVLRGEFLIVERHAHSLGVSYVPPGLDATVAYGTLDFQFRNGYDFPVLLHTQAEAGKLSVSIYGNVHKATLAYELYSKEVETYPIQEEMVTDPTLADGEKKTLQRGTKGKKVETYRRLWQGGTMVGEEKISTDIYQGKKQITAVPKDAGL
ncbi:MAG: hypothetical protein HFI72_06710 [Peptococcaceae bacterium]|nr:hypothetical protein [Peptococcaceae bacterium]